MMKKALSFILTAVILLSAFTVYGEEIETPPSKTVISGVASELSAPAGKDLTINISIAPSNGGREVLLQLYNCDTKKYQTVQKLQTEDEDTAKLKVTIPKNKRKRRTGWWKIVVEKSDNAESAFVKFSVTSTNIVTKKLSSGSACIYCIEDKKLIYDKNCHKRRKQASTTKIMTATLLLESGKYNKSAKVSKKAAKTPYGYLNMKVGDRYTNKSLLYALMLPSSNSAAVSIAEGVSGSTTKFVNKMNARAKTLGLKDTHFVTPHGLDKKNHYSSAYDISLIMANIYPKSKVFRKVIASRSYSFKTQKLKLKKTVKTKDKLKDYSSRHKGGKTGYTSGAGYCFSGVYKYGGKTYVVTVLGAPNSNSRWNDMKSLYKYIDSYAATKY